VENDVGGAETAGFDGTSGSLSASFIDVCAAGSSAPVAGTGNICANPLLADNGNPESFDVHETAASPTVDTGSNALVPEGLTSDFFGEPRIQSSRSYIPACTPGEMEVGYRAYPAVVDMGASEFGPVESRTISVTYKRPASRHKG
jgi:hypothetical protein